MWMLLHLAHLVLSSETLLWSNIHTFHYLNIPPGKLEHRIDSLSSPGHINCEWEASSSQPIITFDVIAVVYPCFPKLLIKTNLLLLLLLFLVVVSCHAPMYLPLGIPSKLYLSMSLLLFYFMVLLII